MDRAIEGHPRHQLRVGEVLRLAADLPDPEVRSFPAVRRAVGQAREEGHHARFELHTTPGELVGGVEQLTVHVQLELLRGPVPDPYGRRAAIPFEVGELELLELGLAVQPVHDLDAVLPALGGRTLGPEQELHPLFTVLEGDEGLGGQRGVADPGVPVVPVPHAADGLGERGGRCRRDGAGVRVRHQLERELGADEQRLPAPRPLPAVSAPRVVQPVPPRLARRFHEPRALGRRAGGIGTVPANDQHPRVARPHPQARAEDRAAGGVGDLRLSRAEPGQGEPRLPARLLRDAPGVAEPERGGPARVVEPRCPFDLHLDRPALAVKQTVDLRSRLRPPATVNLTGQREEIGHDQPPLLRLERGAHDVRVRHVGLLPRSRTHRPHAEVPAAPGVQDAGEDAGAAHVRKTAPVDGGVPPDQRDGAEVSDGGIVRDRPVPVRHRFPSAVEWERNGVARRHRAWRAHEESAGTTVSPNTSMNRS
jgi:hypothetical protein